MNPTQRPIDVTVESQEGVQVFQPQTVAGQAWLDTHLDGFERTDEGGVLVEGQARALAVIDAMREAGLLVG